MREQILKARIKGALINFASEDIYNCLKESDFWEKVTPIFKNLISFEAESSGFNGDLDDLIKKILGDLNSEENIKKLSSRNAETKYLSYTEVKNSLDQALTSLITKQKLRKSQIRKLKEANNISLKKSEPLYNFTNRLISALLEIAEKEGNEQAVTRLRRNSVIKSIIPTAKEYIELYSIEWGASRELDSQLKEIGFTKSKTIDDDKILYDILTKITEVVSRELLEKEAKFIY